MTRRRTIITITVTATALAAAAVYFFNNPEQSNLFPRCPIKMLTGYDCPSCGAQRAIHAALHGNIADAIRYNLFLVVAVPFFLLALAASLLKNRVGRAISLHILTPRAGFAYIVLYIIWWITRNILSI